MQGIVYLNGEFLPASQAKISIFDRSVMFADAIYEVAAVMEGKMVDFDHHMERYFDSLRKISISSPLSKTEILETFRSLVAQNDIDEGMVYLQVTRGQADRDYIWEENMRPTVFMFAMEKSDAEREAAKTGINLISTIDLRWARRDIKSVNLLAQVLAKKIAHDAGAYEALMVDQDGFVTECGSTSFFIVRGDTIVTRPLNNDILPGVTRKALIALGDGFGVAMEQRKFSLEEALGADEAFICGASSYVIPVIKIDRKEIGSAEPGRWTQKIQRIYQNYARDSLL